MVYSEWTELAKRYMDTMLAFAHRTAPTPMHEQYKYTLAVSIRFDNPSTL